MPRYYDHCAVPGCVTVPVSWGRYCARHGQRLQMHGHPHALALRDAELRRHREPIRRALADLCDTPAVVAAHTEAECLLNYHAPFGAPRPLREIEDRMRQLRAEQTVPREVLQSVCEVLFLEHDDFFRDLRSVYCALARQVIKLRTLRNWRPNTLMIRALGQTLHETFAVFATGLHRRIDADAERARQRKEAMQHGWDVPKDDDDGDEDDDE